MAQTPILQKKEYQRGHRARTLGPEQRIGLALHLLRQIPTGRTTTGEQSQGALGGYRLLGLRHMRQG